jgi:hypothetical protein
MAANKYILEHGIGVEEKKEWAAFQKFPGKRKLLQAGANAVEMADIYIRYRRRGNVVLDGAERKLPGTG